jgi:hypothetical protein
MENVFVYLLLVTFFASIVAHRAKKLNRNPLVWGITAWIISPLGVYIILEICGRKKVKPVAVLIEEHDVNPENSVVVEPIVVDSIIDSHSEIQKDGKAA